MKKITIVFVLTLVNCSSLVVSERAARFNLIDGKPVLQAGQAENIPQEGFMLELKPGDKISLIASVSGDLVALEEKDLKLTVSKACYLYSHRDGVYLSENGIHFRAIRDFIRGTSSLQIDLKKNTPLAVIWKLRTN